LDSFSTNAPQINFKVTQKPQRYTLEISIGKIKKCVQNALSVIVFAELKKEKITIVGTSYRNLKEELIFLPDAVSLIHSVIV
jgi:hypothetical protein